MGMKEVTMEIKYAAVFASVQAGRESVTSVCDRLGISRKSYYKYLARFDSEGLEGLQPRSRRPLRSPAATPPEMVELIIKARADLAAEGWDNGALSIFYRLLREGVEPPVWRTIHRVLVRQGLVTPQPGKRPRSSYRSFEFPAPDDCWQIDAFGYLLAGGESVVVFEVKDDCSRAQVANLGWIVRTLWVRGSAWPAASMTSENPGWCCRTTPWRSAARSTTALCWWRRTWWRWGLSRSPHGRIIRKPAARMNAATKPCSVGWRHGLPRPRWWSCRRCWTATNMSTTTGRIRVWI